MTDAEIHNFIDQREWTYAKTMPWCPHFYTVRKGTKDDLFREFVIHILENGYKRRWYKYFHTYFDVGEWYYWTMDEPIDDRNIINRAKLSEWHRCEDNDGNHSE